jgi:hypothetical protein
MFAKHSPTDINIYTTFITEIHLKKQRQIEEGKTKHSFTFEIYFWFDFWLLLLKSALNHVLINL